VIHSLLTLATAAADAAGGTAAASAPAAPAPLLLVAAPALRAPDPALLELYRGVLVAHSDWRWVVLIAGLATLIGAMAGLSGERSWAAGSARTARFFGIALDIQVLLGFSMYLILSPLTTVALQATRTRLPVFFTAYHPGIMFAAFIAVHVSAVLVRRAHSNAGHHRRALIFYGITWLMLVAGVPWIQRPWLRF
jgi:hypothetical protein